MYHETIKVRDLSPESVGWKKVRTALNQAAVMIGSVSVLSNDEYYLMKDFLMTEYKDFSAEEMLIAFKKVSSGAINVDAQHFGKLSPMYLGAVLKAFKVERHKALAKELKDKPKEVKIATDEDKAKIRAEFLEQCLFKPYKKISETGYFDVDKQTASTLYKLFRRANIFVVKPDEEDYFIDLAEKDLFNEARNNKKDHKPLAVFMNRIKDMNKGNDKVMYNRITERACTLYFFDYIMNLHKNKRDIELIAEKL